MKRPVSPSSSLRRPVRLVAEFSLGYFFSKTICVISCRGQMTCVISCRVQTTCVISCRVQTTCEISCRVQTTCVIGCRVQITCVIGCRVQSSPLSNNPCDWLQSSVLSISETTCVIGCRVQSRLSHLWDDPCDWLRSSVPSISSLRQPSWLVVMFPCQRRAGVRLTFDGLCAESSFILSLSRSGSPVRAYSYKVWQVA